MNNSIKLEQPIDKKVKAFRQYLMRRFFREGEYIFSAGPLLSKFGIAALECLIGQNLVAYNVDSGFIELTLRQRSSVSYTIALQSLQKDISFTELLTQISQTENITASKLSQILKDLVDFRQISLGKDPKTGAVTIRAYGSESAEEGNIEALALEPLVDEKAAPETEFADADGNILTLCEIPVEGELRMECSFSNLHNLLDASPAYSEVQHSNAATKTTLLNSLSTADIMAIMTSETPPATLPFLSDWNKSDKLILNMQKSHSDSFNYSVNLNQPSKGERPKLKVVGGQHIIPALCWTEAPEVAHMHVVLNRRRVFHLREGPAIKADIAC